MATVRRELADSIIPTQADSDMARETSRQLAALIHSDEALRVKFPGGVNDTEVTLPATVVRALGKILEEMALGNAVSLIPINSELSTQQAADALNVSRPYLVKLIDEKKLPCRRVGKHRRVMFKHLMLFKQQMEAEQEEALDELTKQAQKLNMGY